MCHKPTRAEGQAKLKRWAEERRKREREPDPRLAVRHTSPRGNGDRDQYDLERGIERLEAMLGQ
jgi:hypothetical protein